MSHSSDFDLFSACNRTELLQLCARAGIGASPATPKERLIAYLLGEEEPPQGNQNDINSWRHGIMSFLLDHWTVVRAQLDCPAKSQDPRSCFKCIDQQVISCLVENPGNEPLIQLKRKNET